MRGKPAAEPKSCRDSPCGCPKLRTGINPVPTFIILCLLNFVSYAVTAESISTPEIASPSTFIDVSSDHWAAYSVNNLVRLGVTQGYPDGTFRGERNMSRYEMATFLSKMANAKNVRAAENEKLNEELKAEVSKLRYTMDTYKRRPGVKQEVSGKFLARLRIGNLVSANAASSLINASIGPVFDYRLIANFKHEFSETSYLRLGMDTMDSSLVGGRDLAREMLEAEGVAETKSGFGVSMTAGPGMIIHREGPANIFPSEDNKVYLRPRNGIRFYYDPGGWDAGAGYRTTSASTSGASAINDVYGYMGYTFRGTFLGNISLRYSADSFTNNLKATYSTAESSVSIYEMIIEPSKQVEFNIKIGISGGVDSPHNMFAGVSLAAKDLMRKDSSTRLYVNKIGADFLDYPTYPGILGVNFFDKLYQAGTYDMGFEISQVVSKGFSVKIISDLVTGAEGYYGKDEPKSNGTFEFDMDFGVFENAVMTIAYRTYQEPSAIANATSDMLGLGFRYTY